ncbi:MAG: hypothetical protein RDV48_21705 [Candidatus Eremiobacteraeota bacterium]|nr:hypothetical protein [Candidatus Eremiobacteraeota bacterium]
MYHVGRVDNGLIPSGGYGRVNAPGLEQRMENQNARVQDGISEGSLSEEELQKVRAGENRYEAMLQDFKANDGKVGPKERMLLNHQLDKVSGLIYADKHN